MLLIELAQKANEIGFTIGADAQGLKLVACTDKARAICNNMKSIQGIDSMHNLQIIINLLTLIAEDLQFKAIYEGEEQ